MRLIRLYIGRLCFKLSIASPSPARQSPASDEKGRPFALAEHTTLGTNKYAAGL